VSPSSFGSGSSSTWYPGERLDLVHNESTSAASRLTSTARDAQDPRFKEGRDRRDRASAVLVLKGQKPECVPWPSTKANPHRAGTHRPGHTEQTPPRGYRGRSRSWLPRWESAMPCVATIPTSGPGDPRRRRHRLPSVHRTSPSDWSRSRPQAAGRASRHDSAP